MSRCWSFHDEAREKPRVVFLFNKNSIQEVVIGRLQGFSTGFERNLNFFPNAIRFLKLHNDFGLKHKEQCDVKN
jgi:hypothetical protein